MQHHRLIDRCRKTRAACALVRAARQEAADALGADRRANAPTPSARPAGVPVASVAGGLVSATEATGQQIARAGQEPRRYDVRTSGLWWGSRYELRDQTLFDHELGRTYGMALNDGVPWSEAEITRALFLTAGPTVAGAFLDHAGGRPPVLLSASAGRQRARQAALRLAAPDRQGQPGNALVALSGAPTGVAPIIQPYSDPGHPPPFGNRSGSTSL